MLPTALTLSAKPDDEIRRKSLHRGLKLGLGGFYSAAKLLAMPSAVFATAIPSVCLSVRPSLCHMLVPYTDE